MASAGWAGTGSHMERNEGFPTKLTGTVSTTWWVLRCGPFFQWNPRVGYESSGVSCRLQGLEIALSSTLFGYA